MSDDAVIVENPYRYVAYDEADAAAALTPGNVLEYDAAGDVQRHSTATGPWNRLFADLAIDPDKDKVDDYVAGERVRAFYAGAGMVVDALLAAGENAAVGDLLASDGAGALQVYTGQAVDEGGTATYTVYEDSVIVGEAVEAVDNSGGADPVRIQVRVH